MIRCAGIAAAVALVAVPSASSTSLPIRHGVGIGPVKLGMSGTQVRRILGAPRAVIERRVMRGVPYTELEYDFGAWNIGFLGRKGQRRVVLVGTGLRRERTAEGVGVGTTEAVFWRRVRGKGYHRRTCENGIVRVPHWVRIQGASETVFFPGGPIGQTEVTGVEVRTRPAVGCAF